VATTEVKSEIAGTVQSIEKHPGDEVAVDDVIALLDCMKMEIPVVAPTAGRIAALHVKPGDMLTEGQLVAVIER
jgi:acetyl-CoA carboxylase biotin carboxyl carrier protein